MKTMLARKSLMEPAEIAAASQYFNLIFSRMQAPKNSTIIGRYSCLPYYHELELDLSFLSSKLINTHLEHQYIANMDYYFDVSDFTPKTWFRLQDIPSFYRSKPLVLKGRTNSKKLNWSDLMYAQDYGAALDITSKLLQDFEIATQSIVYREYVPLEQFDLGNNGLPISNEWRIFYFKKSVVAYGFYWKNFTDIKPSETDLADFKLNGLSFSNKLADIVSDRVDFFVLDIARTIAGDWILIEVNDGQQSGLCGIDPFSFYKNLSILCDQ